MRPVDLTVSAVLLLGMGCITIFRMMEKVAVTKTMLSTIPMGPKSRRALPRAMLPLLGLTSTGRWGDTQHTTVLGTGLVAPNIVGVLETTLMIRNAMVQCHLPIVFNLK